MDPYPAIQTESDDMQSFGFLVKREGERERHKRNVLDDFVFALMLNDYGSMQLSGIFR